MGIAEMHIYFRQYAQQMGMQNVRGILPAQIDIALNTSILDITNQIVRENVGVRNDRVIANPSKINQVNALRSLYKVVELPLTGATPFMELDSEDAFIGLMSNKYDNNGVFDNVSTTHAPDHLYLVDFSVCYKATTDGYGGTHRTSEVTEVDDSKTIYFEARIIDEASLANTLFDYILRNKITSPIIVTYNDDKYDLYIDRFYKHTDNGNDYYRLANNLIPFKLKMSYIQKPAVVRFFTDITDATAQDHDVDCDLPESMHIDIVKHAVDLYLRSIHGNLYNTQQTTQPQQSEQRS